ncbi:flagellar motor protein MotB [Paenibacillus lutimineralis]|uniref:Flagellar motor protein MotB n=1 Tax=Paenibacillus lutimineralis TaxID=2707005 RepID=A0A3Q9I5Q1_9BACL|nr:flagellar motor protein MotB [Paenibacillus lutimineralis]AZS13119.1 flagellar motor protein MotB [Paenibacillus lutimineralis]
MRKRNQEHEEHADESWLLPYSDLMTLLLAMFIVLFGMSSVNAEKFKAVSDAFNNVLSGGSGILDQSSFNSNDMQSFKVQPKPDDVKASVNELRRREQENLEGLKKQLDNYIKQNGLTNDLDTKLNQSQLMITISDKALFPSGEAEVKPDARKLAEAISDMLEQFPDYEVIVSGHTDNIPISNKEYPSNWDLSSARALNFMKILMLNTQLDPQKFSAIGYGEYHPVSTNESAVGRAQNRRVEVSIIRKYVDPDQKLGVTTAHE